MTLVEHLIELRSRLFYASIAVVTGLIAGYWIADPVFMFLQQPYIKLMAGKTAKLQTLGPADSFTIRLQLALWIGLILGAPVWLYQLWAFVAPGLHKHERRWAYVFVGLAAPLFIAGAWLAYVVIDRSLHFLVDAGIGGLQTSFEASRYIDFVTTMLLLFGVAFEFPLLLLMLNFTGVVSGKKLASWWRVVVFICTAFAAVVTPDPGVFGMLILAGCMSFLYFIAVGVALLNDKRKGRGKEVYAGLDDDEVSPLEDDRVAVGAPDGIEPVEPVAGPTPVAGPSPMAAPKPLDSRYDEMT